jgi:6-pyruvoyltetrahydropterin/6-carboxytetrahydropterin synthase
MIRCTRRLGIDAGHRVTRHESKCRNVHGHRYEVEITVEAPKLDHAGRVVDFGVMKEVVGGWLLDALDHGYLHAPWDALAEPMATEGLKTYRMPEHLGEPTAENIAALVAVEGQRLLNEVKAGLTVVAVRVYETPSCWADWTLAGGA